MAAAMRRNIVHIGADSLNYEIRSIVQIGRRIEKCGVSMRWENIGDPIHKGERPEPWILDIAHQTLNEPSAWGYSDSKGQLATREVLAYFINHRGGVSISVEDILFFNGLGDAITKIFGMMRREARILGPSPAYSTLSSAEAAHSGYEHLTYQLDPSNGWLPDIEEIRKKVHYNDTIAGILLINPNNPTGAVYPRETMEQIVEIARQYDLMVICDEIYSHIVYNGATTVHLSEVLGEVPGLALRGISKEFPWPGSRCGWIEILNRGKDPIFDRYVKSLIDAKMLEVCSTSLPQAVIPRVYRDPRFIPHLDNKKKVYEARAREVCEILASAPGVSVVQPRGAFYLSVVFEENAIKELRPLKPANAAAGECLQSILRPGMPPDQRFVYQLMAAKGICTVPLSSFCSSTPGLRTTLLENDDGARRKIYEDLRDALKEALG